MPIDVHAHYLPEPIFNALTDRGASLGVEVRSLGSACERCLRFSYGLEVRAFPSRMTESVDERRERTNRQGVSRQILSVWTDVLGYGLSIDKGADWHKIINDALAGFCDRNPDSFSWLASGPLLHAAAAARELERSVLQAGAIGAVVAANIDGLNLGEADLDEFWAAAVQLGVPVFIHPAQPQPTSRTRLFSLNPIVQYAFDATLAVGSLILSGVLDRFPDLRIILSHGGGAFPYLLGRFDCLHRRMKRASAQNVTKNPPSDYIGKFHYDTRLHPAKTLRYLADLVSIDRLLLETDDPFPPREDDPIGALRAAGFEPHEIERVADVNTAALFACSNARRQPSQFETSN